MKLDQRRCQLERLRHVSYTPFDVQKDDSYTRRGRVERPCADFSRNSIGSTRGHPFGSFARGTRGNVTSAGWQVTLCDPMWHLSSRSGVATLRTAIHLLLTYLLTHRLNPGNNRGMRNVPPPGTTKDKYRPISCRR